MFRNKITLEYALELEEKGDIIIVSSNNDITYHPKAHEWLSNFDLLKSKARHIQIDKILKYFSALYVIEIPRYSDDTTEWFYLYGIENNNIKSKIKDNIEYIYILINPGYPDLVKIGMTEKTVEGRVKSINATSTVNEWVAKFALPVSKGSAYKIEQQIHKYFASERITSDHGNEREFFKISSLKAFDKLREIGALHQVGEPIIY
jgi:hypothetical protein